MSLKVLFRTNKETNETFIVGQTNKEGKELDQIKRGLADDGGNIIKDKEGDFKSESFLVESYDKTDVRTALGPTESI